MRHPGHPSRQIDMVPIVPIDCRIGRPPAPAHFSDRQRLVWERLTAARRPNWFSGSEHVLADYVTQAIICEDLQRQLCKTRVGTGDRFMKLVRLHRQSAQLAAHLAVKLRLTPSSKTDKHLSNDGERPPDMGYPQATAREPDC
jgi:hypothetical protein